MTAPTPPVWAPQELSSQHSWQCCSSRSAACPSCHTHHISDTHPVHNGDIWQTCHTPDGHTCSCLKEIGHSVCRSPSSSWSCHSSHTWCCVESSGGSSPSYRTSSGPRPSLSPFHHSTHTYYSRRVACVSLYLQTCTIELLGWDAALKLPV